MSRSVRWPTIGPSQSVQGFLVPLVVSTLLACITADAAQAQDATAPIASRALFGSDRRNQDSRHKVDFSLSFDVTNENKLATGAGGEVLDRQTQPKGLYSALEGSLIYRRKTKRITLGVDASSTVRYFPQLNDTIGDQGAGVTLQVPLRRRTQLSASQRFSYFQSYQLPLVAALPVDSVDFAPSWTAGEAVSRLEAYSSTTNVRVTQVLNARSVVEFDSDFRAVEFPRGEADLHTGGASGRLTRRVTRDAALRLGYGQRFGRHGGPAGLQTMRVHDVDVGLAYNRTFAGSTKATTVSISPGSAVVSDSGGGRQYRMTGEAAVTRRLSRSWLARGLYRRSVQFVEGFAEPFLLDSATSGLGGYLGRRVELALSADYSRGAIGSSSAQGRYGSYSGAARAVLAMNRHWALSLDYLYYDHRFAGDVTVPAAIATAVNRHSLRVGVRWWSRLLR